MLYADVYQNSLMRQREEAALWCDLCRCEIYPGEDYYELGGRRICRSCLKSCCCELLLPQRRFAPEREVPDE